MTRRQRHVGVYLLGLFCWAVLLWPCAASAKVTTWTDNGPNNNWSHPGNWDAGLPVDGDTVIMPPEPWFSAMDIPGLTLAELQGSGYRGEMALVESLTVANDAQLSGIIDLYGSTLHVQGQFELSGLLRGNNSQLLVDGDLVGLPGGILEMGSGGLELGGHGQLADLTVVFSSGELLLNGAGAQTIEFGPALVQLGELQIAKIDPTQPVVFGAPGTVTIAGPMSVNADLTFDCQLLINGGLTLSADSVLRSSEGAAGDIRIGGPTTLAGELDLGGGLLTADLLTIEDNGLLHSSTGPCQVEFTDTVTISGGDIELESGSSVTLQPGVEVQIDDGGRLANLAYGQGESGPRTAFYQDGVPGIDTWFLTVGAGSEVDLVDVEITDCDASGSATITAVGFSIDGGNNTNIDFPGPSHNLWTNSSTSGNAWSDPENWKYADFNQTRPVRMETVDGQSTMDLPGLHLPGLDMDGFTGSLTLAQMLTIDGELDQHGLLLMGGNNLVVQNLQVNGEMQFEGGSIAVFAESNIAAGGVLRDGQAPAWIWLFADLHVDGILELPSAAGSGMRFYADITIAETGILRLANKATSEVSLIGDGTAGGQQWRLTALPGSQVVLDHVYVQDCDASGGETIIGGFGSIDGGNNRNWDFVSPVVEEVPLHLSARIAPNPANPATTIHYSLPASGPVVVKIHDLQGRVIRTLVDQAKPAGHNQVTWRGRNDAGAGVASGVYVYTVQIGGQVASGKVTLVN